MKQEYYYTYSITFQGLDHIYFGSRVSRCIPECDISYLGSPKAYKVYWQLYAPHKTILAEFNTRDEAYIHEAALIRQQWAIDKHLSLNAHIPGEKFSTTGRTTSQKQKEAVRKSNLGKAKNYYLVSPSGKTIQGFNLRELCRANGLCIAGICSVLGGKQLHHKAWTANTEAHHLYVEAFNDRGISWPKQMKRWRVTCYINGKGEYTYFEAKADAITYRDVLASQGFTWQIYVNNWKQRLAAMQSEVA